MASENGGEPRARVGSVSELREEARRLFAATIRHAEKAAASGPDAGDEAGAVRALREAWLLAEILSVTGDLSAEDAARLDAVGARCEGLRSLPTDGLDPSVDPARGSAPS
jgi:hypothetical protein